MRILLSDGAGLTARQCATVLSQAGHEVEVLSPDPLCLCRFTRRVRKVSLIAQPLRPGCWVNSYQTPTAAISSAARTTVAQGKWQAEGRFL
jgi:hypothetical protein